MANSPAHQAYLKAKVEQQAFEQTIRNCQDSALLPGYNAHYETLAAIADEKFWAWSAELDELSATPVQAEIKVTHQPVVAGWWHEDYVDLTPGAA
jgi:hypothetical protein